MAFEVFVASRLTEGNLLFPTRIVITDHAVMRSKRSWLKVSEESVNVRNVASVNITTGVLWSDVRIESTGGSDPLVSHGHTKADARRIKELIETLQSRLGSELGAAGPLPAGTGDTRPCPTAPRRSREPRRSAGFAGATSAEPAR